MALSNPAARPPAVLHPALDGGRLFIWAERTDPLPRLAPTFHRWGARYPRALASPVLLSRLLDPAGAGDEGFSSAAPADLYWQAPSRDGVPLASPAAGGDPAAGGPLDTWSLPALRLEPGDALALALLPRSLPDPWLRYAPEWAVLWRAAAVLAGMVRRGAVTPTLLDASGARRLVWRPVPSRADRQALGEVVRALPPSIAMGGARPGQALEAFLWNCADLMVRRAAGRARALSPYRRVPRDQRIPARLWLADLLCPAPRRLQLQDAPAPVRRWMADPLRVGGPGRLVLRLEEPAAPAEPQGPGDPDDPQDREDPQEQEDPAAAAAPVWPLCIYLEPPGEPGALVPAADVWSDPPGPAALLPGGALALADALAQAVTVVPALAPALDRDTDAVALSTEEAWALLHDGLGRLEAQGATVLVPSWWQRRPAPRGRLRLRAAEGPGLFGADALVRFSWEVAVGDATLTGEEFERLVALRQPLVRLGGEWVVLGADQAEALIARWRAAGGPSGQMRAGRALLLGLQAAGEADEPEAVLADGALRRMLDGLAALPEEMDEPPGFQGRLRPYQRRGLGWLHARARLGLGGILADDMGLGKTVQLLALLQRRAGEAAAGPALIVAPTSVVANWEAEAARFTPGLQVITHHGGGRARGSDLAATAVAAHVVLTSYPLLLRDADALAGVEWDGVILDEAQNVKNASAKQAQAARRLRAHYRFALTGTPVENTLGDLWSIFAFVQPGYLGSAEAFRRRLALPIERGVDPAATASLRRLTRPLVLRRSKSDPGIADELPEKTETLDRCHLSREQAALYEAVARELLTKVEESTGMQRKAAVLLALLRLKQVCNHPAHYRDDGRSLDGRSGKLDRLEELLAEVAAEGQRALVFTQFAAWGRRLQEHLRARLRCPVWRLDGSTPAVERAALVGEFQGGEGPGVFVLSLKAGGAGLNLTAARHVFHYDRWWNPAVERQATDRAHRIGQRHSVHVHLLQCVGTLEERIDELIRRKAALADDVLGGAAEAWLTELGDAELRDLVSLRRAALGA